MRCRSMLNGVSVPLLPAQLSVTLSRRGDPLLNYGHKRMNRYDRRCIDRYHI